jgi:hypothetical protein
MPGGPAEGADMSESDLPDAMVEAGEIALHETDQDTASSTIVTTVYRAMELARTGQHPLQAGSVARATLWQAYYAQPAAPRRKPGRPLKQNLVPNSECYAK